MERGSQKESQENPNSWKHSDPGLATGEKYVFSLR